MKYLRTYNNFLFESLKKVEEANNPEFLKYWNKLPVDIREKCESIKLNIDIGDTLLGGKFKNKQVVVKEIDKDENGQIIINGKPLLKFRIWKNLPKRMKDKYKLKNKD